MSEDMRGGFLRRWSDRKNDARQGKPLTPEPAQVTVPVSPSASSPVSEVATLDEPSQAAPVPTLDQVRQLTSESDFSAFVGHEVPADVKNAALKKLFTDPHFNVMDGLDVYIDDYSQPDPLAPATLRQMASAKFLQLVEDPDEPTNAMAINDVQTDASFESVAQCDTGRLPSNTIEHDHADLRLQPDPAPGPQDPGPASG